MRESLLFFVGGAEKKRLHLPFLGAPSLTPSTIKAPIPKQIFKRIHAAFVEASCNPFYTADSVREEKERESEREAGQKGNRKERKERGARRPSSRPLLPKLTCQNFNTDAIPKAQQAIDSPKFDAAVRAIVSGA